MPLRRASARRLLITCTALVAILVLPALASANSKLQVGFLDNTYATGSPTAFWSDAVALHVGFMRWDVQWGVIAPTRPANPADPADPAYDWGPTDQFVKGAAEHGLQDKVMFTLWKTPVWATTASTAKATQMPQISDWRAFVHAVAVRYSGGYTPAGASAPLPRVVSWETWNEPNASFAFRPQKVNGKFVSPRNYVKLLNALESEVNAVVDFTPTFVAGAMYKQGSPGNPTPVTFLQGLKAAHAKFDVLSMHPYNNLPMLGVHDGMSQGTTNPKFIGVGNFSTFINRANQIFGKRYPIWVTEFGWATPAPGKDQYTVPFAKQALFVKQSIQHLRALPQVEKMTWFLVVDNPPRNGAWYTTGLIKSDLTRKPSFSAWAEAASALRASTIH